MPATVTELEVQALQLTPSDPVILSTHPLAQDELVDGAVYYATEGTPDLGDDFIDEVERSVALLRRHPEIGAPWRGRL